VIGKDNRLLWHLPEDLKFFKRQTTGKVMIMGRKTYESIGSRPLPNRTNVVITRNRDFEAPAGVVVFHSLNEALEFYKDEPEICIAGGQQIFEKILPYVDIIYLTRVHTTIEGDTFFPDLDPAVWKLKEKVRHEADEKHAHAYTFMTFERITPLSR